MSTIVTRAGKGSALTWTEGDANFTNLNTDKYQSGDSPSFAAVTVTTGQLTGLYSAAAYNVMGLGVAGDAWAGAIAPVDVFRIGATGALWSTGATLKLSQNVHYNTSYNLVYRANGTAVYVDLSGGQVNFYGAASGTAGNTISFNNPLMVDGGNNLVSLIAGQLKFPATQRASSDATTLDDYEEGSWTPIDGSGAGLSITGSGRYIKIGKLVHIQATVVYPATASGANAGLAGLPIADVSATARASMTIGYTSTANLSSALLDSGSTGISLFNAATQATNADLTGAIFYLSGTYEATS